MGKVADCSGESQPLGGSSLGGRGSPMLTAFRAPEASRLQGVESSPKLSESLRAIRTAKPSRFARFLVAEIQGLEKYVTQEGG